MIKILAIFTLLVYSGSASELSVMKKACERGVAEACHDLGILYSGDHGVKEDAEKEKDYLAQGCDLDSDKSCRELEEIDLVPESENMLERIDND